MNVVYFASLLESLFCAVEFTTANVVFLQLSLFLFSETLPTLIWHTLIPNALSLLYFSIRYKYLVLANMPKWFGLLSPLKISKVVLFALIFHSFQVGLALLVQHLSNNWIFSINHITAKGTIDWNIVASVCFFSPFMEEFIFRGMIFYIISLRTKNNFIALRDSNIIFGLFHLTNIGVARFHPAYVVMQVIYAPMIGYVLGTRFVVTKTLWENIILHTFNNITAILVPPSPSSYSHPVVLCGSIASLLFYAWIYYYTRRLAKKQ